MTTLKQFSKDELIALAERAALSQDVTLASLVNECLYHRTAASRGEGTIWAESGVSLGTGRPFVRVRWQDLEGQLDPSLAKGLGQSILDAAYSAEHDAHFVAFLEQQLGLSREAAAAALGGLRAQRERQSAVESRPS